MKVLCMNAAGVKENVVMRFEEPNVFFKDSFFKIPADDSFIFVITEKSNNHAMTAKRKVETEIGGRILKADEYRKCSTILGVFALVPGTPMYEQAKELGIEISKPETDIVVPDEKRIILPGQ
jgi:hypothetical protein